MPASTNRKDHYATLGLAKEATLEDIKAAYKSLALQWHPDRHVTSKEDAARKFIEINEAYRFLSDQGRREWYDNFPAEKSRGRHGPNTTTTNLKSTYSTKTERTQPSKPEGPSASGGLKVPSTSSNAYPSTKAKSDPGFRDFPKEEVLKVPPQHAKSEAGLHDTQKTYNDKDLKTPPFPPFSQSPARAASEGRRPQPATEVPYTDTKSRAKSSGGNIEADLKDFIRRMSGVTQKVHKEPPILSSQKATIYDENDDYDCFHVPSKETGAKLHTTTRASADVPAEWIFPLPLTLEELYEGASQRYRITRHLLSGNKTDVMVEIDIGSGWKEGTKIRFTGAGNERKNNTPQDVVFVVEELPHNQFVRQGSTLITHVQISLREALAGGGRKVQLVGLNSKPISCEIPSGIIKPGDEYIIKGAGMPIRKHGKVVGKGDLVVRWDIQFPPKLTKEQRQQLERILSN